MATETPQKYEATNGNVTATLEIGMQPGENNPPYYAELRVSVESGGSHQELLTSPTTASLLDKLYEYRMRMQIEGVTDLSLSFATLEAKLACTSEVIEQADHYFAARRATGTCCMPYPPPDSTEIKP